MRKIAIALALLALTQWGCSGEFWGGAAAGALGAGAGYETQVSE